jgi:L-alanine-DL-glutamate epimerase-like enolase superfamily enzyme
VSNPIRLDSYHLTRFELPRQRVIGDSQIRIDIPHYIATLELNSSSGLVGLGFFSGHIAPLPPLVELERLFEVEVWHGLKDQNPHVLLNRLTRPRGGNIRSNIFTTAVDQALWDLQGKELGLPLYQLLGGTKNRTRAYASGLDYHLTTEEACAFFANAKARGFTAFKIKVGHPDLQWDLARLTAIVEVVGKHATLMVDANEAWSPKEAIRRAFAYRDAGFDILWIEDPCLRDDYDGLAMVAQAVPFSHINTGEYLDLRGKRKLIESHGADILNVHGNISDTLRAAWLAAEYGIPVSLGNTQFEIGVHLAAALPECIWMEYSFLDYNDLLDQPVQFVDSYAIAPEQPGHGLSISERAKRDFIRP